MKEISKETYKNKGIILFVVVLMSFLNINTAIGYMIVFLMIMSMGTALFQPSNNSLIMSAAPKNKLGIAGSVNSLVRNLAQSIGIMLSTTILYNFMSYKIGYVVTDYIENRDDVFIYGMKYVYIILSIICAFGALVTVYRLIVHNINLENK